MTPERDEPVAALTITEAAAAFVAADNARNSAIKRREELQQQADVALAAETKLDSARAAALDAMKKAIAAGV